MGGFSMKWTKWELSLAVGLAVMLLFCAAVERSVFPAVRRHPDAERRKR